MDLCGCFCVAPARFVLLWCFSVGETQIWPGDLRVVAGACFVCLFVCWLLVYVSMMCLGCEAKEFLTPFYGFLLLLSLSGPSLRARSATTEEKKSTQNLCIDPFQFSFVCTLSL